MKFVPTFASKLFSVQLSLTVPEMRDWNEINGVRSDVEPIAVLMVRTDPVTPEIVFPPLNKSAREFPSTS